MGNSKIKLTILVDNSAASGLLAEHGFSLWVEADNKKILFDTGQGTALHHNAKSLDVDLSQTEYLILSHGHYDHTGGLPDVLPHAVNAHLYCHSAAFLPRYSITDSIAKPIKMFPKAMACVDNLPENRVHWVTKPVKISPIIGITGEIPRHTDYENTGGHFYFDQDGKRTDPVKDDMAFWIESEEGLIVCIGCCHAGIINTLDYIIEQSGQKKIRALIGGLHLLNADEERMVKTVEELKKLQIGQLVPCHCTGDKAHKVFKEEFNAEKGYGGMQLVF